MYYRHILVMIDLSQDSYFLINKANFVSNLYDTKISIIYVNTNCSGIYTGLIDVDVRNIQTFETKNIYSILRNLKDYICFPIYKVLIGNGNVVTCLLDVIKKYNVDLVILGHYQDFWGKMISSIRHIVNSLRIDMLIVPFYQKN